MQSCNHDEVEDDTCMYACMHVCVYVFVYILSVHRFCSYLSLIFTYIYVHILHMAVGVECLSWYFYWTLWEADEFMAGFLLYVGSNTRAHTFVWKLQCRPRGYVLN